MRYAIFSDIHANRQAWDAVVADMERLEVQVFVCLGDIVGYGPCPKEVLSAVRRLTKNIVVGNHDAAAAGTMDSSVFNPTAKMAIDWTRDQLDEESLAFLAGMPMAIESGEMLFVHAEITQPGRFGYIETIEEAEQNFDSRNHQISFVGHTHRPTLFCRSPDGVVAEHPDDDCVLDESCRYIVNVGSVGEPRSFDEIRARYVIYDSDTRKLYFRRIEFSPDDYRVDLMGSGLEISPFFLALFDSQEGAPAATRAMAEKSQSRLESEGGFDDAVGGLVVPDGIAGDFSSVNMPVPMPQMARSRRRGMGPVLLVLPVLAALIGGVIYFGFFRNQDREQQDRVTTEPVAEIIPWRPGDGSRATPKIDPEIALIGPPIEAMAAALPEDSTARIEPDAPVVAVVPEVTPDPKPMVVPPGPAPVSVPMPVPTPEAPMPEHLLTGLGAGLIFYASMDEGAGSAILLDLSRRGRDLERAGAKLGAEGQIGSAGRLEGNALLSTPKPLPLKLEALTISFWLQRPVAADPTKPTNLVSLHEYLDLRLENNQIVADLDRMGETVRADFPGDDKWHHVLVENGSGITTVWIDGASSSDPRAEKLASVPAAEVAVAIGSPESNFTIDEIAIWERRFERDEIANVYRRGKFGSPLLAPERTVAYWNFDEGAKARLFSDSTGENALGSYRGWTSLDAIAPKTVPLTLRPNTLAASVMHLAEKPEKAGNFLLRKESAFTYEGWVKFTGVGGTLGGTMTEVSGSSGWRVAAQRAKGANGYLAFMYGSGDEKVQALAKELPLFDGLAHHFAAVWDPAHSAAQGRMTIFFDNKEAASTMLAHSAIQSEGREQFQIKAIGKPMILDELRFSSAVLEPKLFLTAGMSASEAGDPSVDGESVLERRDREMRERKQRQKEARLRAVETKKLEEAERQKKLEERKAAEEEKRKRERLGID